MNKCFFIGTVILIDDFKFILDSKRKHKSKLNIKINLLDGTIINAIGYDEKADYILRNELLNKSVIIQGRLSNVENELKIVIHFIKNIDEIKK